MFLSWQGCCLKMYCFESQSSAKDCNKFFFTVGISQGQNIFKLSFFGFDRHSQVVCLLGTSVVWPRIVRANYLTILPQSPSSALLLIKDSCRSPLESSYLLWPPCSLIREPNGLSGSAVMVFITSLGGTSFVLLVLNTISFPEGISLSSAYRAIPLRYLSLSTNIRT